MTNKIISFSEDFSKNEASSYMKGKGFDQVLIRNETGEFVGYYILNDLDQIEKKKFSPDLFLDFDTPILTCFKKFSAITRHPEFFLITFEENIIGIITKADLNKPRTRNPLAIIIHDFEATFIKWILNAYNGKERDIQNYIGKKRFEKLTKQYQAHKEDKYELTLFHELGFRDIIKILKNKRFLIESDIPDLVTNLKTYDEVESNKKFFEK